MRDLADDMYLVNISIHAPREGGDVKQKQKTKEQNGFQSTPPARGATLVPFAFRKFL